MAISKPTETKTNPPDAAVKQAAEVAVERLLGALREQLVPATQGSSGEVLRGAEERLAKLGQFAVSERMKGVSERIKAAVEEVLTVLREQLVPSLQSSAREVLREAEGKVNSLVASAITERLTAVKGAAIADVTQHVLRAIPPPAEPSPAISSAAELLSIVSSIQGSSSQSDILRALLDGSSIYCGRCAIFIVRGGNLVGWQGRGFNEDDSIPSTTLDVSAQPIFQWIKEKAPVSFQESSWRAAFLEREGRAHDRKGWILPLLVREKVVAVLFADAGVDAVVSVEDLQLLVRSTGQWLELVATRKASPIEPEASQPTASQAEALAVAPARASSAPRMSPADEELHRKAQRFAKLLVDEIKLYNQAKVTEGRSQRDLYQRLRDDIEKSRATYDKRYAGTPVESANYFHAEVVRILAEDDVGLMGSDFPH